MARRAPTDPRVVQMPLDQPEDYAGHPEIASVAMDLISRHEVTFAHLANFRVLYLVRHGTPPQVKEDPDEPKVHAIAKAFKAPALWRDISGAHGGFWVWAWWWNRLGEQEREAVCLHELLHLGIDDKGRMHLEKHDIEEFSLVVRHYGTGWDRRLADFAHQMALFDRDGGQEQPPSSQRLSVLPSPEADRARDLKDRVVDQVMGAVVDAANRGALDGEGYTVRVEGDALVRRDNPPDEDPPGAGSEGAAPVPGPAPGDGSAPDRQPADDAEVPF